MLLPENTETCPSDLRVVLDAWKQGKVSGQDLIDASYRAQLDQLDHYRRKALPTNVPEAVRFYRGMDPAQKHQMSASDRAEVYRKHEWFFREEEQVKLWNQNNRLVLEELLAWAKEKSLPDAIQQRIVDTLHTHQDLGDADAF